MLYKSGVAGNNFIQEEKKVLYLVTSKVIKKKSSISCPRILCVVAKLRFISPFAGYPILVCGTMSFTR